MVLFLSHVSKTTLIRRKNVKAHYYKEMGESLEPGAVFYLCVDGKVHLAITDHQWGEVTCRVAGACDSSCVKEMNLKEGPMEVTLKGQLLALVEQFLASNGKECGNCDTDFRKVMEFTKVRSPLPLQNHQKAH